MIIFYDKKSGDIVGSVFGRIHTKDQKDMYIGDPNTVGKIVCEWKPVKNYYEWEFLWFKGKVIAQDFEPNSEQKDLFINFDKNSSDIYNYKVDITTGKLYAK
jgi:hypothetical protein